MFSSPNLVPELFPYKMGPRRLGTRLTNSPKVVASKPETSPFNAARTLLQTGKNKPDMNKITFTSEWNCLNHYELTLQLGALVGQRAEIRRREVLQEEE